MGPGGIRKDGKAHKPPGSINWPAAKERFLAKALVARLTGAPDYTLEHLAADIGSTHGTVRNRASSEKWYAELKRREAEARRRATDELQEELAEAESKVRQRHAALARRLVELGEHRLDQLLDLARRGAATGVDVDQMIRMVDRGMKAEREALGIGESDVQQPPASDSRWASIEAQTERFARAKTLLLRLEEAVEEEAEE